MSCDQLPLVRRIMVDRPKSLDTAAWRAHLDACEECRGERYGLQRSLAVYRQVELQLRADAGEGPSWEAFAGMLAREQRWQRVRSRIRAPLAAASVFVAVGVGTMLWPLGVGLDPSGERALVQDSQRPAIESAVLPAEWTIGSSLLSELSRMQLSAPALAPVRAKEEAPPTMAVSTAAAPRSAGSGVAPMAVTAEAEAPAAATEIRFQARLDRGEEPVRAPVLLFRSLRQQQEVRRPPIRVLPVSAPAADLGVRPFAGPRPIR